jgi:hypothetical protein
VGRTHTKNYLFRFALVSAAALLSLPVSAGPGVPKGAAEDLKAFQEKKGTAQGSGYRIIPGPDGNGVILITAGPDAGKMMDASGTVIHASQEFVAHGKTFTDRAAWLNSNGPYAPDATIKNYQAGTLTTYKDGRPQEQYAMDADGNKGRLLTSVDAEKKKAQANQKTGKKSKDDECAASVAIDPTYTCSGTHAVAKAAEVGNQVLTSTGRGLINQMGGTAAQRAQNGTQSSVHEGAAQMAKTGYTYEAALTAANVAAAYSLKKKEKQHSQNLAALRAERDARLRTGEDFNGDVDAALIEQAEAKKSAQASGFKAAMTGLTSAAAAKVAKNMQKDAEKNARAAKSIEKKLADTGVSFSGDGLGVSGAGNGGSINQLGADSGMGGDPSLTNPNVDTTVGGGGTPGLGDGKDLGAGDDSGPASLPGGKFKSAENGGGGSGGGGGGGGGAGGGTGAGTPATDDPKAQYATEFGTKERYESGGSPGAAAKGGAKAGGKEDGGIDLNGLLAQFLPKSEEDLGPKNGILDFGGFGGGRAPANTEEAPSYLDKNADLFQRIHETYTEKNRKGLVGL